MISRSLLIGSLFCALLLAGCQLIDSGSETASVQFEYNLRESPASWDAFFTDFNVDNKDGMELKSEYANLPEPLDTSDSGLYISALNQSDDVKMMFRRQIEGLEPNGDYSVHFTVRFATSVPSGCVGIGGPPGEAVRVIADATEIKPQPFIEDGYYRLNIQHQNGADQWYQNAMMGNIANSRECEEGERYEIKELTSGEEHAVVKADDNGKAWLMVGTRSGFEGRTELYYTHIEAIATRI